MQQNNKTQVSPFQKYRFTPDDLEELGPLGAGNYGTVLKMNHKATGTEMAVKVRCGEEEREMERRRGGMEKGRERECVCVFEEMFLSPPSENPGPRAACEPKRQHCGVGSGHGNWHLSRYR